MPASNDSSSCDSVDEHVQKATTSIPASFGTSKSNSKRINGKWTTGGKVVWIRTFAKLGPQGIHH
eukprot:4185899-Pyramimonas_sp.AAC.1